MIKNLRNANVEGEFVPGARLIERDLCDNVVLQEQLRRLHARIALLRSLSLNQPGRASQSLVEIKALVDAIERGDGTAAWNASVAHVEAAGAIVLSVLKDDEHAAAE